MPRLEKKAGGGRAEGKEKRKESCCSIYLSLWPSVLVTGKPWLDRAGVRGRGVRGGGTLCPQNGAVECSVKDGEPPLPLPAVTEAGRQLVPVLEGDAPIHIFRGQ